MNDTKNSFEVMGERKRLIFDGPCVIKASPKFAWDR